jgi:hypothetical protein
MELSFFFLDSDPCKKDPCQNLAGAVVQSCIPVGAGDFECHCQEGFKWVNDNNFCARLEGKVFTIENLFLGSHFVLSNC